MFFFAIKSVGKDAKANERDKRYDRPACRRGQHPS